ncbi:MAG: hypothetical protein Q9M23_05445, partial [Mariprofundaceae bacterium]|nr:hypothetical protein [Mariprofundaceae bacterium]
EIMQWTSKTGNVLNVPASGRGYFGTTAKAGAIGDDITELCVLHENPITMALKVMTSTGDGTNGVWDVLPKHWGAAFEHAVVADWLTVGQLLTGVSSTPADSDGWYFKFILNKPIECKKFIEAEICRNIGAFPVVKGDGSLSLNAYNDLANADKVNADAWLTVDNIVSFGELSYDYKSMANELWIDYAEFPILSGKYVRAAIFNDSVSKAKHGEAKQLKYVIKGLDGSSQSAVSTTYQRFQRVMSRYSRPPMKCTMKLLPRMNGVEIGDIVRVTYPVRDLLSGADLDRAFEVLSVGINLKTGEPSITCIAQPEVASFWFGGVGQLASISVSPVSSAIAVAETQQLILRA